MKCMTQKLTYLLVFFFLATLTLGGQTLAGVPSEAGVRRFGIFIGANDGGPDRVTLRWAVSDAQRVMDVMEEFGGIRQTDSRLLVDPSISEVYRAFSQISQQISDVRGQSRRVEVLVYYSGHSDESGFMLGREHLGYQSLRQAIDDAGADVSIAILDSCASGAFTRLKGGLRVQPFLVDDSAQMKGYAFLTSASADEAAQESDRIGASFFTHFLVSGLRGAADATGDGRVSLNEAYHYAFNETLSHTVGTLAGPQHPSYDIQLNGSGDLILSEPTTSEAILVLDPSLSGRIYIRHASGQLAAEFSKVSGQEVSLGLRPGEYAVSVSDNNQLQTARIQVKPFGVTALNPSMFSRQTLLVNRSRGDSIPEIDQISDTQVLVEVSDQSIAQLTQSFGEILAEKIIADVNRSLANAFARQAAQNDPINTPAQEIVQVSGAPPVQPQHIPFLFTLVPGVPHYGWDRPVLSNIAISPLIGVVDFSQGFQVSGIGSVANRSSQGFQSGGVFAETSHMEGFQFGGVFTRADSVQGFQVGGVFTSSEGSVRGGQVGGVFSSAEEVQGVQVSGVFNKSLGEVQGAQISGVFNVADDNVTGVQIAGIVNHAQDVRGAQAGLVNIAEGTVYGTQIGLINVADDMYGLPLGLFSWVRQGIKDITLWYVGDERMWIGAQRGSRNFYHILSFGWNRTEDLKELSGLAAGLGLGTRLNLGSLFVDGEIGLRRASTGDTVGDRFTSLFTGPIGYTFPHARVVGGLALGRKLKLYLGLDLDGLVEGWGRVTEFHTTWDGDDFTVPVADGWGVRVFPKFIWGFTLF